MQTVVESSFNWSNFDNLFNKQCGGSGSTNGKCLSSQTCQTNQIDLYNILSIIVEYVDICNNNYVSGISQLTSRTQNLENDVTLIANQVGGCNFNLDFLVGNSLELPIPPIY